MSITSVSSTEARNNWADILNRAAYSRERFAVERHGEPIAAIVSADDLDVVQMVSDRAVASEALEALEKQEGTSETVPGASPESSESDFLTLEEAIQAVVAAIRRHKEAPHALLDTVFRSIAQEFDYRLPSLSSSETGEMEKTAHDTLY